MPQILTKSPKFESGQQATSGTIFIISGPPGSGKTSVARMLADTAERPTTHVVTDSFYMAIRKGFVLPYLPEAAQQNEVVIDAIVASMMVYARGGYDVVVDGIIGPWSLAPFVQASLHDKVGLSFVVLRPSLRETLSRAMGREGEELKASGPLKGLYQAFENLGELEKHVIDSTSDSIEETVERVRTGVSAYRLSSTP
jgi:cytidylate kinase